MGIELGMGYSQHWIGTDRTIGIWNGESIIWGAVSNAFLGDLSMGGVPEFRSLTLFYLARVAGESIYPHGLLSYWPDTYFVGWTGCKG